MMTVIMKKIALILLTIVLTISFSECSFRDLVIASLPVYKSEVFYTSGGFQDFTDYAKYTYDSVTAKALDASKYLKETTAEDVEEILLHIEDFEKWVEAVGGELKENYDFDKVVVTEGNFFYIETKAGKTIGEGTYDKFANYTVYYFDVGTQTLYYFHNNI